MVERSIRLIVTVPDGGRSGRCIGESRSGWARHWVAGVAGLFYIVWQHPAPGTQLREWDSVAVRAVKHGDAPDREPADPLDAPPADSAHAQADREQYLDLAEDDSRD